MINKEQQFEIGIADLGVMGRNLVLNMADHGFSVAGYDKDPAKVEALRQESKGFNFHGASDIADFISLLRKPRAVLMLVPAGPPVNSVIKDLLPHFEMGDLIVDAGNSYFKDTDVRARANGVIRSSPVRQEMKRLRDPVGASGGYVYSATVSATHQQADYTARLIPQCDGVTVPLEDARILWSDETN